MTSAKKRIYIGLVGFGLAALLLDRAVLSDGIGGPSQAAAAGEAGRPAGESAEPPASRPVPRVAFPAVASMADERPPRDFFARPDAPTPLDGSGGSSKATDSDRVQRNEFEAAAKLEGVIVSADGGGAVVNGVRMVRGDSILGCTLELVLGRSAHFRCPDGEAVLFIAPRASKMSN